LPEQLNYPYGLQDEMLSDSLNPKKCFSEETLRAGLSSREAVLCPVRERNLRAKPSRLNAESAAVGRALSQERGASTMSRNPSVFWRKCMGIENNTLSKSAFIINSLYH